jgi:hypothetical protein
MTSATQTSAHPGLAALAKATLPTELFRRGDLERLSSLLHPGESVVTLGEAVFRSERMVRHGLVALTDERLICVDSRSQHTQLLEFRLSEIESLEFGVEPGAGDAKRGDLMIVSGGVKTHVGRIRPWECAAEIAATRAGWSATPNV